MFHTYPEFLIPEHPKLAAGPSSGASEKNEDLPLSETTQTPERIRVVQELIKGKYFFDLFTDPFLPPKTCVDPKFYDKVRVHLSEEILLTASVSKFIWTSNTRPPLTLDREVNPLLFDE